ncbi:MAG: GntR family transcriptional regulator [Victivallales bacterium]|nr:GntR family transcriptional regulator [Victivallales bacterium]
MSRNRYLEISRQISDRINRKVYVVGEPLPPRQQLASEFKVARATIDRCIEHLMTSGLLFSRNGSGTYVSISESRISQIAFISNENIRLPRRSGIRWHYFDYEELKDKSSRDKLLKFDGLIWSRPEEQEMNEWIPFFINKLPLVLVNRTMPEITCVSTDYRGAYREITLERLKQYPECRPFFLKLESAPAVSRYRESGFIDACRDSGCFYDLVYLPDDFAGKFEVLNKYDWGHKFPLLLVSDSFLNTGAVMKWVGNKAWKWKKDILYSDFDNILNDSVWGVKVTSYIPNDSKVISTAIDKISNLIKGNAVAPEPLLIAPERRNGDT